jgi:hypothetical protein
LWYLQCSSFCSILPWLIEVFCASIWTLELIFQSLRNMIVILMGIALNLYINFSNITTFTILNLPFHDHGKSFHLLKFSLISFFNHL